MMRNHCRGTPIRWAFIVALTTLVTPPMASGDDWLTPFADPSTSSNHLWAGSTIVLGDLVDVGETEPTAVLQVIDRIGPLQPDATGRMTVDFGRSADQLERYPLGPLGAEWKAGRRVVVAVEAGPDGLRVPVLDRLPRLCWGLELPQATQRADLSSVRRMSALTLSGIDAAATPQLVEGLASDDPWLRLFSIDALDILYFSQPSQVAEMALARHGLTLAQVLEPVITLAKSGSDVERLLAAQLLDRRFGDHLDDESAEALRFLTLDASARPCVRDEAILSLNGSSDPTMRRWLASLVGDRSVPDRLRITARQLLLDLEGE